MPIEPIGAARGATALLSDSDKFGIESERERRRLEDEQAARKSAQFPAPNELARLKTSPVAPKDRANAEKAISGQDKKLVAFDERQEAKREFKEILVRRELVAVPPSDDLRIIAENSSEPVRVVVETRPQEAPISVDETRAEAPVASPRDIESISRESVSAELEKSNTREALQIISQALPAKAGEFLDLTI